MHRPTSRPDVFRTERRERSDRYEHDQNPHQDFVRDEEEHVGYPMRDTERRDWDTRHVHAYEDYDSRREGSNRSSYDEERGNWNSERRNDYENPQRYASGRNSMGRPYDANRFADAERSSLAYDRHATYGSDYSSDAARAGSFGIRKPDTDINYGTDHYSSSDRYRRDITNRHEDAHFNFSGRGPKSFKRSDERIKEEICEMLTRSASIDAENIDVKVRDGEVTLSGTVPQRHMKHLAEDLSERSLSVKDVINNIRVKKEISPDRENFVTESDKLNSSVNAKKSENSPTSTPLNPNH